MQKPPIPGEPHGYFWVPPPHNKLVELPVSIGRRQGWKMEGEPFVPEKAADAAGECGCQGVPLVYWWRLVWYGEPWPLRLRVSLAWPPVVVADLPGCGCLKFWKDFGRDFRMFRHRHRATIAPLLRRHAARVWIFRAGSTKPPTPSADGSPSDGPPSSRAGAPGAPVAP